LVGDSLLGLAIAAALALLAFTTTGGVALAANTWAQIVLVLVAAGLGIALLITGSRGRRSGALALACFGVLAALTFASLAWSVQPANSWLEANRTLSYAAVFAIAMALARVVPGRWRAVLGGVALYTVVISVYALLTKVFPASMDAGDALARVRAPFDYYNATGLVAAMGIVPCVWWGARRDVRSSAARFLSALSVPALSALTCTLVLSYGRGALGAAIIALGVWFVFVPLRLRGALVLGLGGAGGLAVSLWATRQAAIANDHTSLAARVSAGHSFGLVLLGALMVLTAAGWAMTWLLGRPALPEGARRRIGIALVSLVALVPVAGVVGLATSARGFGGEVSHLWTSLTNPNGFVLDQPGRLAELGSSRPRYWRDGLRVGEHAPLAGTGAFGFAVAVKHYSPDKVLEAHSYVIQTFADFGAIGLVVSAALLIAWALAVRRTLAGGGRAAPDRASPEPAGVTERGATVTILAVAIAFGVHSAIDWTWFIPGAAVPGILCAGWVAGRGPLEAVSPGAATHARRRIDLMRVGAAVGLGAAALLAAWIVWQPLRSANAYADAVSALVRGNAGAALTDGRTAAASEPLDIQPLQLLSEVQLALGDPAAARAELLKATTLQPSNPDAWSALAAFDTAHGRAGAAARESARVHTLSPYT
jgi:hypothetical protein